MTPDEARVILAAIAHLREVGERTADILAAAVAALTTGDAILDAVERLVREAVPALASPPEGRQP